MHPPAMTMTPTIAPAPGLSALPRITALRVIPVAGRDGMLLNLSGAHAPFFTRNLLVLTDASGRTGVGEVPGGEKIRQTLEDAGPLVVGQTVGSRVMLGIPPKLGYGKQGSGEAIPPNSTLYFVIDILAAA